MHKLLIEDDEGGRTAVSLIRDEITIGRKEGNTIRLTDRNVSRRHGRIVCEDDRVYVEDVAARYGIKKNGERIDERAELGEGDVVRIGDYRLTLKVEAKKKTKKKSTTAKKKVLKKPKARAPGPPIDEAEPTEVTDLGEMENGFEKDDKESTQVIQTMPAKLVVISSNFAGEEFPLNEKETVIGRGDTCNIIIDHRSISGKHAKLVREDNTTYKIVDLNSKNGVVVSGESYRATLLQRGDVIELGHVKFRFVEPGENYVFTPQAAEELSSPSESAVAGSGGGLDPKVMVGIVGGIVALALVVGLVIVIGGDDDETPEYVDEETQAAVEEIEELEQTGGEGRVDLAIDRAEEGIEVGMLSGPATRLETIRDMMDPSPEQEERISSLERQIQHEMPFKENYENAVDAAEDGEFLVALNEADQIPGHLTLRTRLENEGVMEDIFSGIIAAGYNALDDEAFDDARELANEVLLVDSDYTPAHELLQDADETEAEMEAIAQRRAEERRAAAATSSTGSSASSQGSDSASSSPSPSPGLTAEEAQDKYVEAGRRLAAGNPQETIQICQEALRAGHTPCHRMLGLAYSRLNDTASACRHLRQYLATGPSNPAAVEGQMESLGCDP